jgi:hypothetical protein
MYDNELLVEFESLIDLDLAMYYYIKDKFPNSEYVDQDFINEKNEMAIIYKLLNRKHINPLEIIMPGLETTNLYFDIMNNHYEELLEYATAYDTFGLMITFLNNASSVNITVWCKSKIEEDFIKKLNPILNTIIIPNRRDIVLSKYTVMYVKYIAYLAQYSHIKGKHIYIAAAKYNMEEDEDMVSSLCYIYSDVNILHLTDLYTTIKYRYLKKKGNKDNEDLF